MNKKDRSDLSGPFVASDCFWFSGLWLRKLVIFIFRTCAPIKPLVHLAEVLDFNVGKLGSASIGFNTRQGSCIFFSHKKAQKAQKRRSTFCVLFCAFCGPSSALFCGFI